MQELIISHQHLGKSVLCVFSDKSERKVESKLSVCDIKMEMRLGSVLKMNSLLGRGKVTHATLPRPRRMTSSLR